MRKTGIVWLLLASVCALFSCASFQKQANGQKHVKGPISHELIFPYGTYMHQVTITVPAKGESPERSYDFSGIVKLGPDAIHARGSLRVWDDSL